MKSPARNSRDAVKEAHIRHLLTHLPTLSLGIVSCALIAGCAGSGGSVLEWVHSGGPQAQNVATILADEKVPGQVFSALLNGDLYVSGDDGKSWKRLSTIRPWTTVYQLVQDSDDGNILYAAAESGLYVSRDRGRAWTVLFAGEGGSLPCYTVAIDPWKNSTLYLGSRAHGIYKSTDRGSTWLPLTGSGDSVLATAEVYDLKVDRTRPDIVVAALWGVGIVRSTDAGSTWERLTPEFTPLGSATTHLVLHPKTGGTLVYATDAGTIARTTNGGETWSITKRDDEAWRVLSLSVDPGNPDILFAGTEGGILRSGDFGSSWTRISRGAPQLPASLALGSSGGQTRLFAYGAGVGVMTSTDMGVTWTRADADLGGATVTLVAGDPDGKNLYAASGRALLRYDADRRTWEAATSGLSGGDITSVAFDIDNPSTMFATSTGGAFRSVNAGAEWTPIARNVRMSPRFMETHPSIKTRMIASGLQGAFVSTDRGNSWFQSKPAGNKVAFRSLTFTPRNAGIVHAATETQGVMVTNDGGLSWEPARYGLTSDSILAVTIDDSEGLTYFAWAPGGECFRSTNRGLEWSRYAPPWNAGDRLMIAVDRLRPASVVALVNGQDLYYSATGGTAWVRVLENGPRHDVLSMHWNARSGMLAIGTRDRGVYLFNLGPSIREMLEE
jgi:photosystem II stability/assembly factor-like uncharacterized protein